MVNVPGGNGVCVGASVAVLVGSFVRVGVRKVGVSVGVKVRVLVGVSGLGVDVGGKSVAVLVHVSVSGASVAIAVTVGVGDGVGVKSQAIRNAANAIKKKAGLLIYPSPPPPCADSYPTPASASLSPG